jgi:hypothetical protein
MAVAQLPGRIFGRARTLNAAIYCAPVSSISPGQRGEWAGSRTGVTQSTDQKVAVVPYSSGVQPLMRTAAILTEYPHTRWAAPVEPEQARARVRIQMLSRAPATHPVAGVMPGGRAGQRNG